MRPLKGRLLLRRLGISLASLVCTLLVAEVLLRVFRGSPGVRQATLVGRTVNKRPAPGIPFLLEPNHTFSGSWPSDPHGYFRNENNELLYRVNNAGFRGPDFHIEHPGVIRVAILGDSFSWGAGVRQEDRFSSVLQERLQASSLHGGRFDVLNFGLGSYDTVAEVALFEHVVLDYTPQICVIWFFLNDVKAPGTVRYLGGGYLWSGLRSRSAVFDLLLAPIDSYLGHRDLVAEYTRQYQEESDDLQEMLAALRRFSRVCASNKIIPVLAVHPVLMDLDEDYPLVEVHELVLAEARKSGILAFDLMPYFRGSDPRQLWVHEVDQHPNHIAHRLGGEALFAELDAIIRDNEGRLRRRMPTSGGR